MNARAVIKARRGGKEPRTVSAVLEARPTDTGEWAVFEGAAQVSGRHPGRDGALAALEKIKARAAMTHRPCLCCRTVFPSEGAHNRLCTKCRGRSEGNFPYGAAAPRRGPRLP